MTALDNGEEAPSQRSSPGFISNLTTTRSDYPNGTPTPGADDHDVHAMVHQVQPVMVVAIPVRVMLRSIISLLHRRIILRQQRVPLIDNILQLMVL